LHHLRQALANLPSVNGFSVRTGDAKALRHQGPARRERCAHGHRLIRRQVDLRTVVKQGAVHLATRPVINDHLS
jgi:hypothetical protein